MVNWAAAGEQCELKVQTDLNYAEEVSFSDDQLQEKVPQKTPRNLTTQRRRYTNLTFEFLAAVRFTVLDFGPALARKLVPIRFAVFGNLGGEAAFLFRLTPF